MTSFKVLATSKSEISEPVLVSFPQTAPSNAQLSKMKFNISEQKTTKKRVIKSEYKAGNIKYEAESTFVDARPNKQASDFYISVLDTTKDKCYLVPVSQTYQMQQTIKDFDKNFVSVKDREYEGKTYFEMK